MCMSGSSAILTMEVVSHFCVTLPALDKLTAFSNFSTNDKVVGSIARCVQLVHLA